MSDKSAIEWTDATWNPTVGCSIVSPGCTNCYAMKVANGLERRFASPKYSGLTKIVNGHVVWTGEVRLNEDALSQPLKWKRGRRIFVNSMSDLFHESLSDADIDRVFAVMALCPQHTFQILTKRAERMRAYCSAFDLDAVARYHAPSITQKLKAKWPLPNVWLGVSAERQQEADERIPLLLQTPAAVRFVSAEPLLGGIALGDYLIPKDIAMSVAPPAATIDWLIVGGESGKSARPMHPEWARSLRDQCAAAGTAFFMKQWGEWAPIGENCGEAESSREASVWVRRDGRFLSVVRCPDSFYSDENSFLGRIGKKAAGRLLDGKEHNEFPSPVTAPQSPQAQSAIEAIDPGGCAPPVSTNPAPTPSVSTSQGIIPPMPSGTLGLNGEGVGAGVSSKGERK